MIKNWGPERTIYSSENLPDYAVFNSIADHPEFGDERHFIKIAEKGRPYTEHLTLKAGKQYEVCISYHNNAHREYDKKIYGQRGIAFGTKLSSCFPTVMDTRKPGVIRADITCENAKPRVVWNEILIKAAEPMMLFCVKDSVNIHTYEPLWEVNGMRLPEEEIFSEKGTYLGYNCLNGKIRGSEKFAGRVAYLIQTKAVSASSTVFITALACDGDAEAQYTLGYMYMRGRGMEKDEAKAVQWFQRAGAQGNAEAQCMLGYMYMRGRGVRQNDAEAARWLKKSVDQGNEIARCFLRCMDK